MFGRSDAGGGSQFSYQNSKAEYFEKRNMQYAKIFCDSRNIFIKCAQYFHKIFSASRNNYVNRASIRQRRAPPGIESTASGIFLPIFFLTFFNFFFVAL